MPATRKGSPVLVVRTYWGKKILAGTKTVEIRGAPTKRRGRVYLSFSGKDGAETVVGTVKLVDCREVHTVSEFNALAPQHQIETSIGGSAPTADAGGLPYKRTFA